MRLIFFTHSLLSDWNHGNAHFLRGLVTELVSRGHTVRSFEPRSGWSITELVRDQGPGPIEEVRRIYPALDVTRFEDETTIDLDAALSGADAVIVHEWTAPALVRRIGEAKRAHRFKLLFHDTHHRSVTAEREMAAYDLSAYDAVLAFGEVIRNLYVTRGWCRRAFTFHEAADVRVFGPRPDIERELDLVWVGNYGDGERARELGTFLLEPVRRLGLRARVYGVRYPDAALAALKEARVEFGGWLPNFRVPEAFAQARVTVHVPRGPYAQRLPGIPTIRPFEALACGIPLISAPWRDDEGLFRPGEDFLVARSGDEMAEQLEFVLTNDDVSRRLAENGRNRILERHTCAHRADELLHILERLG
jgi:spore maturation protein CgeB